jgi:hypothetical protein
MRKNERKLKSIEPGKLVQVAGAEPSPTPWRGQPKAPADALASLDSR